MSSQYQIETTTPDGRPIIVPIPDGFLDKIRDDHARELADRIRNAHLDGGYEGWPWTADLIDPGQRDES